MTGRSLGRLGLAIALLTGGAASARAWEAKASDVERRVRQLESSFRGDADAAGVRRSALARQKRRPGWTRKTHWSEVYRGRTYVFGVGSISGVQNPALRLAAAEDRGRGELLKAAGADAGQVPGARPLDWYEDPRSGTLFVLMSAIR